MMSMKGDGKPVSFIEDCAVPLEHLADYTDRLTRGVRRSTARAAPGTRTPRSARLHVRPILNMRARRRAARCARSPRKPARWCASTRARTPASTATAWCARSGSSRSSAPRLTRAFEEIKDLFDPQGLMNPGKIVRAAEDGRPHAVPLQARLRGAAARHRARLVASGAASPAAVEMCNNNGHCRKFDAGTMCPSYRATRDEQHLTRGRANTLRLALSGPARARRARLRRGARGARPVRLLQGLQARMPDRRRHGADEDRVPAPLAPAPRPRRCATGWSPTCRATRRGPRGSRRSPTCAIGAGCAKARCSASRRSARCRSGAAMPFDATGAAAERDGRATSCCSPTRSTATSSRRTRAPRCACCEAAGYRVHVARARTARGRCAAAAPSSRPAWSTRRSARRARMLEALAPFVARGVPIVGLEPSCLLALRDEFRSMLPGEATERLAAQRAAVRGVPRARGRCRPPQAAARAAAAEARAAARPLPSEGLRRDAGGRSACCALVPGLEVKTIESSCCGMAGASATRPSTTTCR